MNSLSSNSTILRELSPEENQSLKNELVQMFQEILAVCQKHGLTIMLGGGSAFGLCAPSRIYPLGR